MELYRLSISEAKELLDKRKITAKELLNSIYQRIESVDSKVKAFVTLSKIRLMRWLMPLKSR